jgi:hypothetical protein
MRVYVIRDFSSEPVRILLEGMRELYTELGGEPLAWDIPGLQPQGGQIARDIVYRPIRGCDHAIVLLDTPNANVAWEAGLALGFGKSVRLVYVGGELPPWTQSGALKNLVLHHLSDLSGADKALAPLRWDLDFSPPSPAAAATLLLCPGGPEGSTLRQVAQRSHPELGLLPDEGWGLYELPALLAPYSRVIWVIASYPDKADVRDGAENAALGVIAGIAEATDREVVVLRSRAARVVADVQPRELCFRGLAEFKAKLSQALALPVLPRARR